MLEVRREEFRESMPWVNFRGRGWAISSRIAEEELTKENVVLILGEHSVTGTDRKTEIFALGRKPEHAESHE